MYGVYSSSWPEIRLLPPGGGGGGGGGELGSGAAAASTNCFLRASCTYIFRNVGTLDVLYAPTINGGPGVAGPQQTNRNSLTRAVA